MPRRHAEDAGRAEDAAVHHVKMLSAIGGSPLSPSEGKRAGGAAAQRGNYGSFPGSHGYTPAGYCSAEAAAVHYVKMDKGESRSPPEGVEGARARARRRQGEGARGQGVLKIASMLQSIM